MKFNLKVLPSQARAFACQAKFVGFSGPVGSGKTLFLADRLILAAHENPGRTGLLGAPTYPMLRDASLRTFFERLEEHGVPFTFRKSEYKVTLHGPKTSILCRAVENFDRLRGTNLAFFGLDETSYCPEGAWLQLEARLRDPGAKRLGGYGAWTPKGHDWIYRKFIKQTTPNPNYVAILANPRENTHIDPSFYSGLELSYAPNFYKQEVLGEYLNVFSGRAYDQFDNSSNGNIWHGDGKGNYSGFAPAVYDPKRPILWALDFNVSPATSVIAQTVAQTPSVNLGSSIGGRHAQLNVLDELYLPDTRTAEHVEAFYTRIRPVLKKGRKLHVIVYGDASGERRQSSSSRSDYQIISEFFTRHDDEFQTEFRVPKANPLVLDRINAVNALCCNHRRIRRLAVHERCKELIRDLEEVAWSVDSDENMLPVLAKKDPKRTHVSDALGYLVAQEFALRSSTGYVPDSL